MMKRILSLGFAVALGAGAEAAPAATGKRFEWTTRSAEAKTGLLEVQQRIESFEFGTETVKAAQKVVAADPDFAMGEYYLSAVPAGRDQAHLDKAGDSRRRPRTASAASSRPWWSPGREAGELKAAIPALGRLARDYPDERIVEVILGQMLPGNERAG